MFCWPRIVHLCYKTNLKKTDDIILYQYPISTLLIGETNTNFLVSLDKCLIDKVVLNDRKIHSLPHSLIDLEPAAKVTDDPGQLSHVD